MRSLFFNCRSGKFVMHAILLTSFCLLLQSSSYCQQTPTGAEFFVKPISHQDSLLVKRYIDSVNNCRVFSLRRQRYFDSALAIVPWKASWWQQKAMPLYKFKKYEAGSPFLDSAVKYDLKKYLDYRAFMKCIFQKSYHQAIADFTRAKELIGDGEVMDHSYDFYLGISYLQLNQLDSAEYFLSTTISRQKSSLGEKWVHPLDLFYLGIVYYEMEDYTRAVQTFDRCLSLYTNFSDAKFYKANCLDYQQHHEQAEVVRKEAAENFREGYTINEDNAIYEAYPYQVNKHYFAD